jgi:hypothetical protein
MMFGTYSVSVAASSTIPAGALPVWKVGARRPHPESSRALQCDTSTADTVSEPLLSTNSVCEARWSARPAYGSAPTRTVGQVPPQPLTSRALHVAPSTTETVKSPWLAT